MMCVVLSSLATSYVVGCFLCLFIHFSGQTIIVAPGV